MAKKEQNDAERAIDLITLRVLMAAYTIAQLEPDAAIPRAVRALELLKKEESKLKIGLGDG